MQLPTAFVFPLLAIVFSSTAAAAASSSAADSDLSCRELLQLINAERKSNGQHMVIDEAGFIRHIGCEAECRQTLGRVFEYAAKPLTIGYFDGRTSCTVERAYIKRIIAHGLFGRFRNSAQIIDYDSSSQNKLFPLYLKNYFADDTHGHHEVTVQFHRLNPASLNPNGPFQPFIIQRGAVEVGEIEDAVPVFNVRSDYFRDTRWAGEGNAVRLRHLDLMLASQLVTYDLPANAAVLVSGVHTYSTPGGQPDFSGVSRSFVFFDAAGYRFSLQWQYQWDEVTKRLAMFKAAFSAVPRGELIETEWHYSSDDRKLLLLIQALAAAETGHQLLIKIGAGEPMAKVIELKEFMGEVAKHHPQTVLQALRAFLPQLIQRATELDTPQASAEFLRVLAQQTPYRVPPALPSQPPPLPPPSAAATAA